MQITSSSPNFTSRNAYIRRADDIVRHVRNEFPMFSPSSAWDNWRVLRSDNPICKKARKMLQRQTDMLNTYRKSITSTENAPYFIDVFEKVQKTKIGNCGEASTLTLGACIANGYRAVKMSPTVEMRVFDKNSKEVFNWRRACDHGIVMAKMDKLNPKSTKDVVILDTWAGKAMSYKEALKEYNDEYMTGDFLPTLLQTHKEMIKQKGLKGLFMVLSTKFTYEPKMVFTTMEKWDFSCEENLELGEKIAKKFPQILMSEK